MAPWGRWLSSWSRSIPRGWPASSGRWPAPTGRSGSFDAGAPPSAGSTRSRPEMPLHWTIDSRRRTIDIVAIGVVSAIDAMAFFDAIEGADALPYSKLIDGTQARPAMSAEDLL